MAGTFLQLGTHHRTWTEAEWDRLFNCFQRLALSQVIVQWTAVDEIIFYDPSGKSESPLNRILAAAARVNITVWVGLYHDSKYWTKIGGDPKTAALYLQGLRSRSLAIARNIAPFVKQNRNLAGWYLSEEIDDINWDSPGASEALLSHVSLASSGLQELTPGFKVAISAFSNARTSPARFRTFWKEVLNASSIDLVLLQDGIGVDKLELNEFPLYAEALAGAANEAGRHCSVVVELFQQTRGAPLDDGPFQAVAAPWARVRQQLELASRYTGSIFGFSVPEYMTPTGVDGARQLHNEYVGEVIGRRRD